jgi:hypothetical protein
MIRSKSAEDIFLSSFFESCTRNVTAGTTGSSALLPVGPIGAAEQRVYRKAISKKAKMHRFITVVLVKSIIITIKILKYAWGKKTANKFGELKN